MPRCRAALAVRMNDQLAEGSWPGIRTDTDILAPLMSLDRTVLQARGRDQAEATAGGDGVWGSIEID